MNVNMDLDRKVARFQKKEEEDQKVQNAIILHNKKVLSWRKIKKKEDFGKNISANFIKKLRDMSLSFR